MPAVVFPSDWAARAVEDLETVEGFVDACVVEVLDALPDESWTHLTLVGEGTAPR